MDAVYPTYILYTYTHSSGGDNDEISTGKLKQSPILICSNCEQILIHDQITELTDISLTIYSEHVMKHSCLLFRIRHVFIYSLW